MKISEQEIKHIALLARIGLPDKEIPFYAHELSQILEYVEKLDEVKVDDDKINTYITDLHSKTRIDSENHLWADTFADKLLGLVKNTKDRFVKVKAILNKDNE